MTYQIVMRVSDTPHGWGVYQLEDGTWNWRSSKSESGIGFATEKEAIRDAWENSQIGTQEQERRRERKRRRALYEAAMAAGISIPEGWRFDGVEFSRRRHTGQPTNEFFVGPYEGKGFVPIGGNRVCVIDQATALAYDSVKETENPKGYWITPSIKRPSMVIWKTVNFESDRCFDTVPAARVDAWRHSRLSKRKGR